MKQKLALFTEFSNSLYPHEVGYLMKHNQITDPENIRILQRISFNCYHPDNQKEFDTTIDKRKYSNLKKWIEKILAEKDVDKYFEWITGLEKKILTDSIHPDEEKQLIQHLKKVSLQHYHFTRLYETVQHFRDYLLIRMRITYYKPVSEFLDNYRRYYRNSAEVQNVLNDATYDIISQYGPTKRESGQWINYLVEIFRDESLDAYTRYRAVIRLMYVYYNYRRFDELKSITLELEQTLYLPQFYSKRILANYYANRSMMHQKRMELDEAEEYGYLSIRQVNNDYIFYINNLCGILIKQRKYAIGLKMMQSSMPHLKHTNSLFNRIGFVSLYIKILVFNGKSKQAASYAETFRETYRKEIFAHRWHLFFEAYLLALLRIGKNRQILTLVRRNNLLQKELKEYGQKNILAVIHSFYWVSAYLETEIGEQQLEENLFEIFKHKFDDQSLTFKKQELLNELSEYVPDAIKKIS